MPRHAPTGSSVLHTVQPTSWARFNIQRPRRASKRSGGVLRCPARAPCGVTLRRGICICRQHLVNKGENYMVRHECAEALGSIATQEVPSPRCPLVRSFRLTRAVVCVVLAHPARVRQGLGASGEGELRGGPRHARGEKQPGPLAHSEVDGGFMPALVCRPSTRARVPSSTPTESASWARTSGP